MGSKFAVFLLQLFIFPFVVHISAHGHMSNNQINDSLLLLYKSADTDSVKLSALASIAFNLESNNTSFQNNSSDHYIQLAINIVNDSIGYNDLASKFDRYGVRLRNAGNYVGALKFHNIAQELANNILNLDIKSIIANNKGVVFRRLDDYQMALENHFEALRFAEVSRNMKSQAIAINSIGNIQMMIGNLDEALVQFKESLIIEQKLDNLLGIAINLNNIGNVYAEKSDYNKALEYFRLSLDVNKEINSQKGIAICYNDIGKVYKNLGNKERALSYYEDALEINKKINEKYGLAYSYLQVGELYVDLENFNTSLEFLYPGIELAIDIGAKAFIMDGYDALYRVKLALKEYNEAIDYLVLSHLYHDSILNINIQKDIARLQIKFESERKEAQIELLKRNAAIAELDEKRQDVITLLILSALIIAIGIVIFLSYYLYSNNKRNKLLTERNRSMEKAKVELDKYSQQLLAAKQEAEINSKVKSEFLANMSHEIRTPLNSVIGFSEVLERSVKEKGQKRQLAAIKSSARSLLTLINDILDLSKIEAGKFTIDYKPVNPKAIFDDVIQIFSYRSREKNVKLITKVASDIPNTILFNELRLRQILFNVLGNAIKFTEEGEITIEALCEYRSSDTIDLMINITDTGIGINKESLDNVFEPFHQSKNVKTQDGTGLGLAITKRLVEMMNGTIELKSVVGIGTKFMIRFPEIKISNEEIDQVLIKYDPLIKPLIISSSKDKCEILNKIGFDSNNVKMSSGVDQNSVTLTNINLVIICEDEPEMSKQLIDKLNKLNSNKKLELLLLTETAPEHYNYYHKDNVTVVDSTLAKEEIVTAFSMVFRKLSSKERSATYFVDFISLFDNEEFKSELRSIYENEFVKANTTKMSSSMLEFVDALDSIANRYQLSNIKDYCNDLRKSISSFDIDELDVLLKLYDSNYLQVIA